MEHDVDHYRLEHDVGRLVGFGMLLLSSVAVIDNGAKLLGIVSPP
jgi:hypothetical protein